MFWKKKSQSSTNPFSEITKKHFNYLFVEYGFTTVEEWYDPEMFGDAWLHCTSNQCRIRFELDRCTMSIEIGPPLLSLEEWYEFGDVVRYFAPEIEPVYEYLDEPGYETQIEFQASRLASLMKAHCRPLLVGDFSMHAAIKAIENQRVRKMVDDFGVDPKEYQNWKKK